jgi:putative ABC transport system substrate-binding protein
MKRRTLIAALGCAAAASWGAALAQQQVRVGLLSSTATPTDKNPLGARLLRGLAKAGYVPGRNMVVESRGADGQMDRLPGLVKELVEAKVEVIVTNGYPSALAAKQGTSLPIVALNAGDPVGTGLVESLARPGGNVTGVSDVSAELTPKRMEFLRSVAPGLRRIAIIWNDADPAMQLRSQASESGAKAMEIGVQQLSVHGPADFDVAFARIAGDRPDALLMVTDWLTIANSRRVFDHAAAARLPAIYEDDFLARMGGLMAYGPDLEESAERVGALVAHILKGAKPADLPFEQPTRFKFVINLKTAKALGLTIPASLLAAADEVIE